MPDLTIKPVAAAGNKLILQDQAGNTRLQTDDAGITITAPTVADMTNCTFPAGHVLQTVTAEDIDGTVAKPNSGSNSTNPTWIDVVTVSITPSSGTKCICFADAILGSQTTEGNTYIWVRIVRDSTVMRLTDVSSYDWVSLGSPETTHNCHQYSRIGYDTHGANGSTAITYKLQISNQNLNFNVYAGRSHADHTSSYGSAQSSRIVVMEVQ